MPTTIKNKINYLIELLEKKYNLITVLESIYYFLLNNLFLKITLINFIYDQNQ